MLQSLRMRQYRFRIRRQSRKKCNFPPVWQLQFPQIHLPQNQMKKQESKIDPIRSKFGTIEKEEVSLSDKMLEMKAYAAENRRFSFRGLLEGQTSKIQVIVTFLSILELMKMGYVHVKQEELFDDIQVEVKEDPDTWKNLTEFADE